MSTYNQYKFVVEFEKTLAKGVLNGLTVKDRIHFPSEKDARSWIKDLELIDKGSRFANFKIKEVA